MIKKRNLDPSLIQWIMSETGLGPMVGDIRYVAPEVSATSQFRAQLATMGVGNIEISVDEALGKTTDYRNDVVLIAPGVYTESIANDLFGTHLLGCGAQPGAVNIKPEGSYAYTGGLSIASVRNMSFWSPSLTNPDFAAFYATYGSGAGSMANSIIDNCHFLGNHNDSVVGLQIGAKATASVWESMYHSTVLSCKFYAGGGEPTSFQTGIMLFASDDSTNQAKKMTTQCMFDKNIIYATESGIRLNTQKTNNHGTIIQYNTIRSHETTSGPRWGIICFATNGDDMTAVVQFNTITSYDDCIYGFATSAVFGNLVAVGAGAPTSESGQ